MGAAVHAAALAGRVVEGLAGARVLPAHEDVALAVPLGPTCVFITRGFLTTFLDKLVRWNSPTDLLAH